MIYEVCFDDNSGFRCVHQDKQHIQWIDPTSALRVGMAFADIKQEREYAKTMCGSATSFDAKTRLKHREDMFLRRLFAMLGKMAKADGRIDEMEMHAATKAFIYFPRAGVRRKFCVRVFNEAKNGRLSLYRLAWEFSNRWATLDDCVHAYELLWDIACANGILKPTQKSNLKGICKYLNLPEQCFSLCYQKRKGSFTEWTQDEAKNEWKEKRRKDAP